MRPSDLNLLSPKLDAKQLILMFLNIIVEYSATKNFHGRDNRVFLNIIRIKKIEPLYQAYIHIQIS